MPNCPALVVHYLACFKAGLVATPLNYHAVLQRRFQGGTQPDHGSRWIERIQSVRETFRLQHRSPLAYLIDAATAAHHRLPAPSLVPT